MESTAKLMSYDLARSVLGGVGRTTLYMLIDSGELHRVKIGSRAFITAQSVFDYVEQLCTSAGYSMDDAA